MIVLLWLALALRQDVPEPELGTNQEPAPTEDVGEDLHLLHEIRRMSRRVEEMLDVRFDPTPVAVRAPSDLRRVAAEIRLAKSISGERLEARGQAWEDIGLGTRDAPARTYRLVAEDLDGISVDPTRSRLLIDPERLTAEDFIPTEQDPESSSVLLMMGIRPDEPLVLHGLVHLLEQQESAAGRWPETTDELLANRAWREGRANLTAILYLFASVGVGTELFSHSLDPGEVMNGALLPTSIDVLGGAEGALLNWIYRDGYDQAVATVRNGGFAALRQAMTTRPTTRDVKHLDRPPLTANETAIPDEPAPEGMRLADRDSVGEQGIVVIVSAWSDKANLGLIAADGWSGDALLRYRSDDGDSMTLWITRWVSPEEAADFEYGYLRALERRFPGSSGQDAPPYRFEGDGRTVVVTRDGREVRVRITPLG